YAEYIGAIQRESRRVNDRFQQGGWTPIDLQINDDFPQAVAAYKDYDVLLVNAIFDGLNLVAKEAPLVNERDGVLILSENAGAHEELGDWALSVNPFDVAGLVAEAAEAQEAWGESSFGERRSLVLRVAHTLLGRMDDITATVTAETGKPIVESFTTELLLAVEQLLWLASHAGRVLAPERLRYGIPYLAHKRAHVVYEPLGVLGIISPWNFPFSIPLTQAAMAVAAGNAVVLKPSELTPLSGEWVARAFAEAGAPDGLVSVAQGAGETGAALVTAPGIAKLIFAGSATTGRKVLAA